MSVWFILRDRMLSEQNPQIWKKKFLMSSIDYFFVFRFYSNNDEDDSIKWFWEHFDPEHYSIWRVSYNVFFSLEGGGCFFYTLLSYSSLKTRYFNCDWSPTDNYLLTINFSSLGVFFNIVRWKIYCPLSFP